MQKITAYTDSDWGGDRVSRRSTSGGCLMRGSHLLSHWSRAQQVVSLSSAEATLNGMRKAAAEGLGAKIVKAAAAAFQQGVATLMTVQLEHYPRQLPAAHVLAWPPYVAC